MRLLDSGTNEFKLKVPFNSTRFNSTLQLNSAHQRQQQASQRAEIAQMSERCALLIDFGVPNSIESSKRPTRVIYKNIKIQKSKNSKHSKIYKNCKITKIELYNLYNVSFFFFPPKRLFESILAFLVFL